ncbi:MAG TPA: universal stress protein [Verrucomicrobiae bacterium]|nr:universal stress protein [Verrucomicrobiae bacterium]
MYKTILLTLDGSATDRAIIEHIKLLAKLMESRVVLLHVVTSVPAKVYGPGAADKEVLDSQAYLNQVCAELAASGIKSSAELAYGEPVKEIVNWVRQKGCDLVAMSTHGHQFMADLVLGTTAIKVQHSVNVPVLMLKAK